MSYTVSTRCKSAVNTLVRKEKGATMILRLELPPDVEAKLRKGAANHDAESVRQLLTEALAPVVDATIDTLLRDAAYETVPRTDGLTDAEFDALADELVTLSPTLPELPNDAVSRAGIYENHP
jgi:hypothetical protein